MPILYDQYQQANSTQIPQFVGSAIPELTKVADTLQQRYDVGQSQADLLDRAIRTSSASVFDQPELQRLKGEFKDKLAGFAKKGDYENSWRNVAMAAQDFTDRYKNIAANQQRFAQWQDELEKGVAAGHYTAEQAQARLRQVQDTYSGLRWDDKTGQYTNIFSGPMMAKSVNMEEKINKILENTHAIERGSKVTGMSADGLEVITSGGHRKSLSWKQLEPIIKSGLALDPEVQSYLQQERELAPYYRGVSSKMSDSQVLSAIKGTAYEAPVVDAMHKGYSGAQALSSVLGEERVAGIMRLSDIYGQKGVIDEQSSEYSRTMSSLGASEAADRRKAARSLQVSFATPGATEAVTSGAEFESKFNEQQAAHDANMKAYADWLNDGRAPKVKQKDGRITSPDGKIDYTAEADTYRAAATQSDDALKKFKEVQEKAAADVGYDLRGSETARAAAQKAYKEAYAQAGVSTGGTGGGGYYQYTEEERKANAQRAYDNSIKSTPEYKKYEQALKTRINDNAESGALVMINDKTSQDDWSNKISDMISGLGSKNGMLPLYYGSGKNKGTQLSADDYDKLKGKLSVVGFGKDENGKTTVVMRADEQKDGKSKVGENIVVELPNTTADNYLKATMDPVEYHKFYLSGLVKQELHGPTGMGHFEVAQDAAGKPINANVFKESGRWVVTLPAEGGGVVRRLANSYEGVADIILQAQAEAAKVNK